MVIEMAKYLSEYDRFINNLVQTQISRYQDNPDYKYAARFINEPYIFGTFGSESYNRPGFNFINPSKIMNPKHLPTDVGLGQITQPALTYAIKNKIISPTVRLFDLTTIMSPQVYQKRINEHKLNERQKIFYQIQLKRLAKKHYEPVSKITNQQIINFNENAVRNNVKASTFTLFNNLKDFLNQIRYSSFSAARQNSLLTNPKFLRYAYLTYKDGPRGTYLMYKNLRRFGEYDLPYANKRAENTQIVSKEMAKYRQKLIDDRTNFNKQNPNLENRFRKYTAEGLGLTSDVLFGLFATRSMFQLRRKLMMKKNRR